MVDLGGGTRERFQGLGTEVPDGVLPPVSTVSYYTHTHHVSRPSSWRPSPQGQDVTPRQTLLEPMHHDLIQIKSDPENLSRLCSSGSSMATVQGTSMSSLEAAEDARAKGQLLQEITRVAETFEPYSSPPTTSGCYRNYSLAPEPSSHAEYIFSDTSQWSWSRSPTDDRSTSGSAGGGLLVGSGQPSETVISSLQYTAPSHLIPDTFSSALPSISVAQSPTSVPTCSCMQKTPPATDILTSSALDLSPGPPPMAHQLPQLQPSLIAQTPTHMPAVSTPPSAHQLPPLQPSLISLDIPAQALSSHHTLDDTLDLVNIEGADHHEKATEFEPRHECSHCGALFTRLPHLKYHMKVHPDGIVSSCAKQEGDPLALDAAEPKPAHTLETAEKKFSCKHCDETFSRAERLKVHELNHSGERPFRCNECSAFFSAKSMLIRHKKVHTGIKPYCCDECSTCFTEAGSLKVHKRLHSGEKPFKCDQCDVAFNGAGMLATHKRKHTGEKPYSCSVCGEAFRLLSTLKSHKLRHTGEKPFTCELCGSSFTQRAAMQRHRRIHSNQKPWECEQCGFKFREKENLRKHIAIHKIKLQHMCNICGEGFNQAKKLEIHKMLHNGGDRPYQCSKCPSTFTNPKYLMQHKKRVHDRKGAVRCEECNGTFKRKEILRSHMRIHSGERPYVCEECGAAFNQRGTLTKHIRSHSKNISVSENKCDEIFECRPCSHVFLDKMSYERHILDHCAAEDAAFSCPICSLGFSSQKELVRHKRTNHPSQRTARGNSGSEQDVDDSSEHIRDKYVCEDCDQTFFRRRQLKAHKKYCPCNCSALQPEPREEINVKTPSLQIGTKEVDPMKLLTAVLAVTGNDSDDGLTYQQSVGRGPPSSISSSVVEPPSSVPAIIEQPPDRYPSPHLFPANDALCPPHLNIHHQEDDLQQPSQRVLHVPQPSQQDQLQQPLQGHLPRLSQQEISLQQLSHHHDHLQQSSQDNLQQSSHQQDQTHQLNHHQDHLQQLPQDHSHLHQSSQHSHLQQSSQDHVHQPPQQQEHLQQPSRHSHMQQVSRQDHIQQPSRQNRYLQQSSEHHIHLHQTTRQEDGIQHQTRQLNHLHHLPQQGQLHQPSRGPDQLHQSVRRQDYMHHPQIDHIVQQHFYKTDSLSLTSQHLLTHHRTQQHQLHEQPGQNMHLKEDLHQDLEDCDELSPSIHHHDQPGNCQEHHHQLHAAPVQESDHEDLGETKHHPHHHQLHQQQHLHQLHPSPPPMEGSHSVKIQNIMN